MASRLSRAPSLCSFPSHTRVLRRASFSLFHPSFGSVLPFRFRALLLRHPMQRPQVACVLSFHRLQSFPRGTPFLVKAERHTPSSHLCVSLFPTTVMFALASMMAALLGFASVGILLGLAMSAVRFDAYRWGPRGRRRVGRRRRCAKG